MPAPPARQSYDLPRLSRQLRPFVLHYFPQLRSTSDHAIVLRRRRKLFAPAAVVAGRQTAGRGRAGNTWFSDDSAVTATFILPVDEALPPGELPLIAGLAVRAAAEEITGAAVQLKWPNDCWFAGKKLAGLLCERVDKIDLIGVGLNVNLRPSSAPKALRQKITSLIQISGQPIDRTGVLIAIARHLHQMLSARRSTPFARFLREYETHHVLTGRKISITHAHSPPVVGRAQGIDPQGRLLVRDEKQLHHVFAGHVTILD